jgi:tRNA(Ile)-lysidine synthase
LTPSDRLLLAVSGGLDSVVLCELCKQAGYEFIMAHCNFQLRGNESERDENFVKSLGKKYKVEVQVKKFDTKKYAQDNKLSIQEAARKLRYDWFNELLYSPDLQLTKVLTAHHADDNAETLVMNFFRGTGIKGLRGIEPRQERIIRPLLFARRKELENFAVQNKLEFVTDSSNLSDEYSRNYFRLKVIPMLEKIFPDVTGNLLNNIERFREAEVLYNQAIDLHKKKLLEKKGKEVHIPVLKLKKSIPLRTIVYEIIKEFGFHSLQVKEVIALLDSDTGKYICSATHRLLKNRKWLIISPLDFLQSENIPVEEGIDTLRFEAGSLRFENVSALNHKLQKSDNTASFDAGKIHFPLLLRKWKQGDYFYPLGMKKKKKLARFFIDQKLSRSEKEKTWVLEMDKKIIWVIGYRIDDRFKIDGSTKNILTITYSTSQTG